ncbi:MAG: endopeptidase La [Mycoplasma sp.]|nr:endopeptidase La [Mycoplasma sp.]
MGTRDEKEKINIENKLGDVYPFIPTRDVILLEGITDYLEIGRKKSRESVKLSQKAFGSHIVLISQKSPEQRDINSIDDLQRYGVLAQILNVETIGNNERITVRAIEKMEITDYNESDEECYIGSFKKVKTILKFKQTDKTQRQLDSLYDALTHNLLNNNEHFKKIFIKTPLPKNIKKEELKDLYTLNNIVSSFAMPTKFAYFYFSQKSISAKIDTLCALIEELISGLEKTTEIDNEIETELKKSLDKQNKEFLLRERLRVTRNLLGEDNVEEEKIDKIFDDKQLSKIYPDEVKLAIKKEKAKLKSMMSSSPDANITRNYIDLLTQLPWRKTSIEEINIKKVKKVLNDQHYGLKDVKERIIEFVAVMINNQRKHPDKFKKIRLTDTPNAEINENLFVKEAGLNKTQENSSPIITLLGPPGVGKTSIAKSLAEAIGRKFIKISLGGVNDEAEIRGHRKTYVGAMPGKIINAIKRAGVSNPIILLDEIDKLGSSSTKGDPSSALLEVLDPEQNANFQDHFLEIEYDLSKVLFIATANYYEDIPAPLLDRVELIELSSYTLFEKINIAKKYLVAKVIKQNGLDKEQFKINDKEIEYIIKHYTLEAGVRNLQRVLDKLARKVALGIIEGKIKDEFTIDIPTIKKFLGVEKFSDDDRDDKPRIGVVNGLAYTSYGGSTLPIEVTTFPGKGEIKITGQLKDVMQESATVALGYIRSNAKLFNIDFSFEDSTIQIHVPEGAVPKDGPSAGVTFTTAIISALTKKPVNHNIGMTGEITLRGKVLPIGGLKEKSLAALRLGIKTIFIPKDNERNLEDVADEVKKEIKFIPVNNYTEIYNKLFK